MVIYPGGTSVGGIAAGTSSSAIAIPPLSTGKNPKWVHINLVESSGQGIVFLFGQSGVGAATLTNGIGCGGYCPGVIISVGGNTHYTCISNSGSQNYTMTPLAGI